MAGNLAEEQCTEAGAGFLASLRSRARTLIHRTRAGTAALLEAGQVRVASAKETLDEQLTGSVAFARAKGAYVADLVTSRLGEAFTSVRTAREAVASYAETVRTAVASMAKGMKAKGAKVWMSEGVGWAAERSRKAVRTSATATAALAANARKHAVDHAMQARNVANTLATTAAVRCTSARSRASEAAGIAKAKASELNAGARGVAADTKFQVSAASAVGGAAALGASGGAAGLAAGGAIGAAVGVVPALFTLGLSIPLGAAIGSSAGLVVGSLLGGVTGALSGGAAGYGAYSKKEDIGKCTEYVRAKAAETRSLVEETSMTAIGRAREAADSAKAQARTSVGYAAERAAAARSRLVGRSGSEAAE